MRFKLLYLALGAILVNCKAQNATLYVGTYTNGESEGIYKLNFNTETGELTNKQLAVKTENPSFISYSPNKDYMYAVGEGTTSAVTAFKVLGDGKLSFINTENSKGKGPCHISINATGKKAVVSNYGGGTMSLFDIDNSGRISASTQVFDHNITEQKSHVHSAQFFGNDLFVADLGRNSVYLYQTADQNNYHLKTPSIVTMTENAGPRHFTLTKDGNFIYIINEYASTITSAKKVGDHFELIDHKSTLRDDYEGKNSCADIHLSRDERFLYGSNRGENSIAVFTRNQNTGAIEKIQNMEVHGDWPRNFNLDPTGKFLLVANQKSNNITVFKIDPNSGMLTFLSSTELPSPVCLLF